MFENVVVTPCRWEVNNVVEFCLYYRAIGFDHVYIYCNDDKPWDTYGALIPLIEVAEPFVTFVHFGIQGQQRQMLLHWLRNFRRQARHVAFLDADEFLCLPRRHNIVKFLAEFTKPWDVLYFNWSSFGPDEHKRRPEGSVLLNYTKREEELHTFTKVLVKTSIFSPEWLSGNPSDVIWHGKSALYSRHVCRNVLGDDMSTYYDGENAKTYLERPDVQRAIREVAVVNHYAIKSEEDCVRRAERGALADFSGQTAWKTMWTSGGFTALAAKMNAVEDVELRNFWMGRLASGAIWTVASRPAGTNVALNRPATQSSISPWSLGQTEEVDAGCAVNGIITGRHQFHTANDAHAWWRVDLGSVVAIDTIRLFNRLDSGLDRARGLRVEVSLDGVNWDFLTRTPAEQDFGGADGQPFVWQGSCRTRFVMLSTSHNFLHLDQVEIYGSP